MAKLTRKKYRFYPAPLKGINAGLPSKLIDKTNAVSIQNMYLEKGELRTRFGVSALTTTTINPATSAYMQHGWLSAGNKFSGALQTMSGGIAACYIRHNRDEAQTYIQVATHSIGIIRYYPITPPSYSAMMMCRYSGVTVGAVAYSIGLIDNGFPFSAGENYITYDYDYCWVNSGYPYPKLVMCWNAFYPRNETAKGHILLQNSPGGTIYPLTLCAADYYPAVGVPRSLGICQFHGHIFIWCTQDSATGDPSLRRLRWSNVSGVTGGNWPAANYNDLLETPGTILAVKTLNSDSMIVYKTDSIIVVSYIGDAFDFRFTTTIVNEALLAPKMVCQAIGLHYFVGTNGIYSYNGGSELEDIGGPIWDEFIDDINKDDVDTRLAGTSVTMRLKVYQKSFMFFSKEMGFIMIVVPSGTDKVCRKVWVYDISNRAWMTWFFEDGIAGICQDERGWRGDNQYMTAFMNTKGKLMAWSFSRYDDSGVAVVQQFITKTIVPEENGTGYFSSWDQLCFDATASSTTVAVTVQYRLDDATAWTTLKQLTLTGGTSRTRYQLNMNFSARSIQFRFYNGNLNEKFSISQYELRELEIQQ